MQTIIVGGGLIGLSTAHALLERGEEVLVFERLDGVGQDTSFANGGMLTPSLPEPWNGPGVFGHLASSIFNPQASMKLRLQQIPSLLTWGLKFLRNSSEDRFLAATLDNHRLARYSLEKTLEISTRLDFQYDFSEQGTLCIFQDAAHMDDRRRVSHHLRDCGLQMQELDVEQVVAREPVLESVRDKIIGGLWFPDDARGDAHLFCRELASAVTAAGGEIRTGTSVSQLTCDNGRMTGIVANGKSFAADRVVVAAGSYSPHLLGTIGQSVSVKPAKGYSITIDGSGLGKLPGSAIADDSSHAVITSFGERLRICGTAEFAGFDKRLRPERVNNLFDVFESVLPEMAVRVERNHFNAWAGLRPMSDDGRPFIGAGSIGGLFINTGHGALGWTMAMGSANVLADLICGTMPDTDHSPFDPLR